jgi:hypothetical protein
MSPKSVEISTGSVPRHQSHDGPNAFAYVQDALRGLQYGQVTVIVQDGIVVQVERTERKRLNRADRQR